MCLGLKKGREGGELKNLISFSHKINFKIMWKRKGWNCGFIFTRECRKRHFWTIKKQREKGSTHISYPFFFNPHFLSFLISTSWKKAQTINFLIFTPPDQKKRLNSVVKLWDEQKLVCIITWERESKKRLEKGIWDRLLLLYRCCFAFIIRHGLYLPSLNSTQFSLSRNF